MAKVAIATASGVVNPTSGKLYRVNITKVATGSGSVIIYDNPTTNSGRVLFQGDGLSQQSFDMTDGSGGAVVATQGIYIALAGTTNATVDVIYE